MKRFACFIILLLLCVSVSVAEDAIDLDRFNDSELISLLEKIESKLMERNIQRSARLMKGTYVAGKDFPAGGYDIMLPDDSPEEFIRLFAYSATKLQTDGKSVTPDIINGAFLGRGESFHVYLDEDDRIDIAADVILTISNPIVFQ